MSVSTPVLSWTAQLLALASGGVGPSASLTVTVNAQSYWEVQLPVLFSHAGSISADPVVSVFASMDGGTSFDSNPFQALTVPRVPGSAGGARQSSLRLSTGYYCIQLLNSGPNSAFFGVPTAAVITAVQNV